MYAIQVINKDIQEQTIRLYDMNLKLKLIFNEVLGNFQFDLFDIDKDEFIVQSRGLSMGSPSLLEKRLPFIITLMDKTGSNQKVTSMNDFLNRIQLIIMSLDEFKKHSLN